jgi:hypothetical protein
VEWGDVQDAFAGCLDEPVPIDQWQAPRGAGVVAVLRKAESGDGFVLADCLEGADISAWKRYPWLRQRVRAMRKNDGELLVAVCRQDVGDRSRRLALKEDALHRLRPDLTANVTP